MRELTSRERIARMYEHGEADRVPIVDSPWQATIERWQREGLPKEVDYVDYFGLDRVVYIIVDNSPRYEERVVEETEEYKVSTTRFGATMKQWRHAASTPEFHDFTIVDPDAWRKAKERITPDRDRVDWTNLQHNYQSWREKGYWIQAALCFGFGVAHSWIVGTERLLRALIKAPEWCMDMFGHLLEVNLSLLEMVWDAGYTFDCVSWNDDMGYKDNQFFSVRKYREILKPYHGRVIDWAHAKGIRAYLHSCGNINPFVPELVEMGLDALNPLEVKAGMDPIHLKKTYGKQLVFHGGINAALWDDPQAIREEIERVVPVMKESGGYILSSDHSVPSSVSLEGFKRIIELAKKVGSY